MAVSASIRKMFRKEEPREPISGEELKDVNQVKFCPWCKDPLTVVGENCSFLVPEDTIEHLSMLMKCKCGASYQIKYSSPQIISATLPRVKHGEYPNYDKG